jgi:hypothetical protein
MATATASDKLEQLHDNILARQAILGRKGIISALGMPAIAKTYITSALKSIGMSKRIMPSPEIAKALDKAFVREIALWDKLGEQFAAEASLTAIQNTMTNLSDLLDSEHTILKNSQSKRVA